MRTTIFPKIHTYSIICFFFFALAGQNLLLAQAKKSITREDIWVRPIWPANFRHQLDEGRQILFLST